MSKSAMCSVYSRDFYVWLCALPVTLRVPITYQMNKKNSSSFYEESEIIHADVVSLKGF